MRISTIFVLLFITTSNVYAETTKQNPFSRFFGDWTLKDDTFQQVWDGKTVQTLNIPNHFTHCAAINTHKSVLCVVDAGDLKGHILWTFDDSTQTVHHLSHFGESRNGVGTGKLEEQGNFTSKVRFQGEPENTYRIYEYEWVSDTEYSMMSRQYDHKDQPTGNWYGGSFVAVTAKH